MLFEPANAQEWRQYAKPAQAGWSAEKLEEARKTAEEMGSAAVFIVDRGNVVAAWGHVDHPYKAASIRKSLYDATMGAVDLKKPLDVTATIAKLGIDDLEGLTDLEKTATLEHLMTARSGIYHPAAYETASNADRRPERGSRKPGEFWYYNNWDFNLVREAFERLTGKQMASAYLEDLAVPIGMEDTHPDYQFDWLEPRSSRYPALTIRISARDLARVGLLYLQKGVWNGERLISKEWVEESTRAHTTFGKGHYRGEGVGYGRLWWVRSAKEGSDSVVERVDRFSAQGAGGQAMAVFPELDLVIVHLANTDTSGGVGDQAVDRLMEMILGARTGAAVKDPELGPVAPQEMGDKGVPPLRTGLKAPSKETIEAVEGTYMFNPELGMQFYEFEGRLFIRPIGMQLPDAEVFLDTEGGMRSPLVEFLIEPIRSEGIVQSIRMTFRGRTMVGNRKEN